MNYEELIKRVQHYSGLSRGEAEDVLQIMVESLAVRLDDRERFNFADELPEQLQDIALAVYPSFENASGDILLQFMAVEDSDERLAKKRIAAAWQTLKDSLPRREVRFIQRQLPNGASSRLK